VRNPNTIRRKLRAARQRGTLSTATFKPGRFTPKPAKKGSTNAQSSTDPLVLISAALLPTASLAAAAKGSPSYLKALPPALIGPMRSGCTAGRMRLQTLRLCYMPHPNIPECCRDCGRTAQQANARVMGRCPKCFCPLVSITTTEAYHVGRFVSFALTCHAGFTPRFFIDKVEALASAIEWMKRDGFPLRSSCFLFMTPPSRRSASMLSFTEDALHVLCGVSHCWSLI